MFRVCNAFLSGHLLGKGLPLGSLVCDVLGFFCVTFPYGVLGQVWYLIVSIPDLCHHTNFGYISRPDIAIFIILIKIRDFIEFSFRTNIFSSLFTQKQLFCLFDLVLNVPSTIFYIKRGRVFVG